MPDDIALVSAVTGALVPLIYPENWEQSGSMSPDEAAGIMSAAFDSFVSGDCGSGECPPPFVVTPDGDRPIYRRNPTTDAWEYMQLDGSWIEPTGDDEIPDPAPRGESTADDRRCAAATNAANLVKQIYDTVLTDINNDVDFAQLAVTTAAVAALYAGAWVYPPALATISIDLAAFEGFAEAGQAIVLSNLWTQHFTDRYVCCLRTNATDTGGVVTFDRQAVNRCLLESIWTDQQYVLLVSMVIYIHSIIGEQGLNLLGTDTTLTGDCSRCGQWARHFDFRLGVNGWGTSTAGDVGSWQAAGYWQGVAAGNSQMILTCDNPVNSGFVITRVVIDYELLTNPNWEEGLFGSHSPSRGVWMSTNILGRHTYDSGYTLNWNGAGDLTVRWWKSGASGAQVRMHSIRYYGTGTMPFSDTQGQVWNGD